MKPQDGGAKRLLAAAIIFILVLTGFIVLQVAVVGALMKTGLSLGASAFLISIALLRFGGGGVSRFLGVAGISAPGLPSSGTQREIHETLGWIQKILS